MCCAVKCIVLAVVANKQKGAQTKWRERKKKLIKHVRANSFDKIGVTVATAVILNT